MTGPVKLRWDNFTPMARTPWGGQRIVAEIKRGLPGAQAWRGKVLGECWEFSVDPAFPSRTVGGALLSDLLEAERGHWLGAAARHGASTPMLVKLLDADDELSVQVHPGDDYGGLAAGESGKPECWYVLAAEPGSGLFLGLADGVSREAMARALAAKEDLRSMLNFVPVQVGDTFVIGPGTVHAIGRGVTVVEPQLVRPGRSGKTYRLWDWNRLYDRHGRRDAQGQPRTLHVQDSLAVTCFDGPSGDEFVASCRATPRTLSTANRGRVRHRLLCELQEMRIEELAGDGELALTGGALSALIVTAGTVTLTRPDGSALVAHAGETLALPAAMELLFLHLKDAAAVRCWCPGRQ